MSIQAKYVNAEVLRNALFSINTTVSTGYATDPVGHAINTIVSQSVQAALQNVIMQIASAVDRAAMPYDKCMLCVQRDCDVKPEGIS